MTAHEIAPEATEIAALPLPTVDMDGDALFRLGLAYDGAGDRRRAREAIRRAITLEKNPPTR